jgi:hypothetical protein
MYKACFCFLLEILLIQIIVVFLHLFQTESVGVASTTCDDDDDDDDDDEYGDDDDDDDDCDFTEEMIDGMLFEFMRE